MSNQDHNAPPSSTAQSEADSSHYDAAYENAYEQHGQYEAQAGGGGVPKIVIYIGALIVINIILIAVDAPFYIY